MFVGVCGQAAACAGCSLTTEPNARKAVFNQLLLYGYGMDAIWVIPSNSSHVAFAAAIPNEASHQNIGMIITLEIVLAKYDFA